MNEYSLLTLGGILPCFVEDPKGDITSATSDIEASEWLSVYHFTLVIEDLSGFEWSDLLHKFILP